MSKYKVEDFSLGSEVIPFEDWLNDVLDIGNGRDSIWKVIEFLPSSQSIKIKALEPGISPNELWVPVIQIEYKVS